MDRVMDWQLFFKNLLMVNDEQKNSIFTNKQNNGLTVVLEKSINGEWWTKKKKENYIYKYTNKKEPTIILKKKMKWNTFQ